MTDYLIIVLAALTAVDILLGLNRKTSIKRVKKINREEEQNARKKRIEFENFMTYNGDKQDRF